METTVDPAAAFFNIKIDKTELAAIKSKYPTALDKDAFATTEEYVPFIISDSDSPFSPNSPKASVASAADIQPPSFNLSTKERSKRSSEADWRGKKSKLSSPARDLGPSPGSNPSRPKTLLHWEYCPWMNPNRTYSLNITERLHQEIVEFLTFVSPTEEERYARHQIIDRVERIVKNIWPTASVNVFGSYSTQLYLPSSDIDLVVLLENSTEMDKPPLKRLARALDKADLAEPGSIKTIPKARVPLIKYLDKHTNLEIDISFNIFSGIESADIINKELATFPAMRPLILLLKQFLEQRGLNEVFSGGIGSYTLMCMVLSFFQMHPLIQTGLIRPHENLGVLLLEFFELYGKNFNYDQVGISVLNGGSYYSKEERGWLLEQRPHLLSIEDPQNPQVDIAKGSFAILSVRQAFEHGFNILVAAMSEYDRWQRNETEGKNRNGVKSDRPLHHHQQPSVLSSIVKLSEKTLRHRYYIEQTTNL